MGEAGSWAVMHMTHARLIRLAGLCALIAGLSYVVVGVAHPANLPTSVTTTRWEVVHVFACAMSLFGVLGLTGLSVRQAERTGWLGVVGFVLLTLWMMIILGFSFVEAFVLPHLAHVAPGFIVGWMDMFNGGHSPVNMGALPALWTLSAPLYIGGGLLFGVATFRAGVLPRAAAVLLAVGTLAAPLASQLSLTWQPKIAVLAGLALAWLGFALLTEHASPVVRRDASLVPVPA
jgi:hypothetical protein